MGIIFKDYAGLCSHNPTMNKFSEKEKNKSANQEEWRFFFEKGVATLSITDSL